MKRQLTITLKGKDLDTGLEMAAQGLTLIQAMIVCKIALDHFEAELTTEQAKKMAEAEIINVTKSTTDGKQESL